MGIQTARGLLFHVPRRYDDASTLTSISHLEVGMDATASGRVRSKAVVPTRSGLRIFQAVLQDQSGMITVAWPGQPWLDRKIRRGDLLLVTGPVKFFHGRQLQPREHTLLARGGEGDSEEVRRGDDLRIVPGQRGSAAVGATADLRPQPGYAASPRRGRGIRAPYRARRAGAPYSGPGTRGPSPAQEPVGRGGRSSEAGVRRAFLPPAPAGRESGGGRLARSPGFGSAEPTS